MLNHNGKFGDHGGQYIPETLMNAVILHLTRSCKICLMTMQGGHPDFTMLHI